MKRKTHGKEEVEASSSKPQPYSRGDKGAVCSPYFRGPQHHDLFIMRLSGPGKTRKCHKKRVVMPAPTAITPSKLKSG